MNAVARAVWSLVTDPDFTIPDPVIFALSMLGIFGPIFAAHLWLGWFS